MIHGYAPARKTYLRWLITAQLLFNMLCGLKCLLSALQPTNFVSMSAGLSSGFTVRIAMFLLLTSCCMKQCRSSMCFAFFDVPSLMLDSTRSLPRALFQKKQKHIIYANGRPDFTQSRQKTVAPKPACATWVDLRSISLNLRWISLELGGPKTRQKQQNIEIPAKRAFFAEMRLSLLKMPGQVMLSRCGWFGCTAVGVCVF